MMLKDWEWSQDGSKLGSCRYECTIRLQFLDAPEAMQEVGACVSLSAQQEDQCTLQGRSYIHYWALKSSCPLCTFYYILQIVPRAFFNWEFPCLSIPDLFCLITFLYREQLPANAIPSYVEFLCLWNSVIWIYIIPIAQAAAAPKATTPHPTPFITPNVGPAFCILC